jgi:hypothetical protein
MPAATRGPRQFDQRPGGKILEHMLEQMIDILAPYWLAPSRAEQAAGEIIPDQGLFKRVGQD